MPGRLTQNIVDIDSFVTKTVPKVPHAVYKGISYLSQARPLRYAIDTITRCFPSPKRLFSFDCLNLDQPINEDVVTMLRKVANYFAKGTSKPRAHFSIFGIPLLRGIEQMRLTVVLAGRNFQNFLNREIREQDLKTYKQEVRNITYQYFNGNQIEMDTFIQSIHEVLEEEVSTTLSWRKLATYMKNQGFRLLERQILRLGTLYLATTLFTRLDYLTLDSGDALSHWILSSIPLVSFISSLIPFKSIDILTTGVAYYSWNSFLYSQSREKVKNKQRPPLPSISEEAKEAIIQIAQQGYSSSRLSNSKFRTDKDINEFFNEIKALDLPSAMTFNFSSSEESSSSSEESDRLLKNYYESNLFDQIPALEPRNRNTMSSLKLQKWYKKQLPKKGIDSLKGIYYLAQYLNRCKENCSSNQDEWDVIFHREIEEFEGRFKRSLKEEVEAAKEKLYSWLENLENHLSDTSLQRNDVTSDDSEN